MRLFPAVAFVSSFAVSLVTNGAGPHAQESVAQFYAGRQIRLITSVGPASGYSVRAHLIANYLPRHIPGNPSIVVEGMIGGGGLKALDYLYSIAPKDGSEIGAVNRLAPAMSIVGARGADFDSSRFDWLGSPTTERNMCVVTQASPVQTIDDLFEKQVIVGTDGVGSGLHIFPTALNAILGTKFKVIDGYKESGEVLLAMDRGEIQGACQSEETLMNSRGDAIRSGRWRILLQGGTTPDPRFPSAPFVIDYAKTPAQKQALQFLYAAQSFGRPYLAPPGVPADRLAALQKAFEETMKDPDFLAAAAKAHFDVSPISGAEISAMIARLKSTPKDVTAGVATLIASGNGN